MPFQYNYAKRIGEQIPRKWELNREKRIEFAGRMMKVYRRQERIERFSLARWIQRRSELIYVKH